VVLRHRPDIRRIPHIEVSRGAHETGSASQQVLSAAKQLSGLPEELKAAVSSFLERVKAA